MEAYAPLLMVAGAFLVFSLLIPLINPTRPTEFSKKSEEAKFENSETTLSSGFMPLPHKVSKNNSEREVASVESEKPLTAESAKVTAPGPRFLSRKNGDYFWQPNVYAVTDLKFAKSGQYLGKTEKFSVIKSGVAPQQGFPLVWSEKYGQYGLYTGKVIIISEAGHLPAFLQEKGLRFSNLSGSFVVEVKNMEEAFQTVKAVRKKFPRSLVDIDIDL